MTKKILFINVNINVNIIFYFYSLPLEDNIVCNLFFVLHFQTIQQKVYTLLENLDQLRNLTTDLFFLLIFLVDIYKLIALLKPDFHCFSSFALHCELRKLQLERKFLYQLLKMLWLELLTALEAAITQFSDQFRSRLISQLIKGISRVLRITEIF